MRILKIAAAAAAMAMACTAMADGVTLSGSVSTGLVFTKNQADKTKSVTMESAWAGDSIWAITGDEDLGNGWKVDFHLENEFGSDDGHSEGGIFESEAIVRISNDFVGVALGNLGGTLASGGGEYDILSGFDPLEAAYGIGGMGLFATRDMGAMNAMAVELHPLEGLTLAGAMSLEDDQSHPRWADRDHYYGLAASYENGPLAVAAVAEAITYSNHYESSRTDDKTGQAYSLAASWDFEVVKPMVMVQYTKNVKSFAPAGGDLDFDRSSSNGRFKETLSAMIGATAPLGEGTLAFAAQYLDAKMVADGDAGSVSTKGKAYALGLTYTYELSKRTSLYSGAVYSHGSKGFKKTAETTGSYFNQWQVGVGINHTF